MSSVGTAHVIGNQLFIFKCFVPTALDTEGVLLLGGLKSAATKLTEPTALLDAQKLMGNGQSLKHSFRLKFWL